MTDAAFEARVTDEARRFDLRPLLQLLAAHGYPLDHVLFESARDGSGASLVEAVTFRREPVRQVIVTLNVGLLGDNSLLPSYFLETVEKSREPERFYDFIRFFDDRLIRNLLRAVYPEDDTSTYGSWQKVQSAFFRMLGLGSTSTLQWLIKQHFPELRVVVQRRAFASATASHAFRTGESRLDGTGILGRVYESEAAGFVVDLFADEETDSRGRGWPVIVRARLNEILLPLLAPHRIPLLVRLQVLFHASWVRVDFPFADEHGYLGYERIRGDADQGHRIVIYRGVTGAQLRA